MTEKPDPHKTHHYSHDQLIKYAYTLDMFHVRNDPKYADVKHILEKFMQDRIKEITDRWK
jgi:hypothetical protein